MVVTLHLERSRVRDYIASPSFTAWNSFICRSSAMVIRTAASSIALKMI
jgi:hypothetical protein